MEAVSAALVFKNRGAGEHQPMLDLRLTFIFGDMMDATPGNRQTCDLSSKTNSAYIDRMHLETSRETKCSQSLHSH